MRAEDRAEVGQAAPAPPAVVLPPLPPPALPPIHMERPLIEALENLGFTRVHIQALSAEGVHTIYDVMGADDLFFTSIFQTDSLKTLTNKALMDFRLLRSWARKQLSDFQEVDIAAFTPEARVNWMAKVATIEAESMSNVKNRLTIKPPEFSQATIRHGRLGSAVSLHFSEM